MRNLAMVSSFRPGKRSTDFVLLLRMPRRNVLVGHKLRSGLKEFPEPAHALLLPARSQHPQAEIHAARQGLRHAFPRLRPAGEISLRRNPRVHAAGGAAGALSKNARG